MEGMSSNVLAVVDGCVHTAGTGVLLGTVRDIILRVCRENLIPVSETPPRVDAVAQWQGCMVSSTSRLALPVSHVQVCDPDGRVARTIQVPVDGVAADIDRLVQDAIGTASEPLDR